ncbi:D-glycero-beta-D-manno-heptose 1-phosphate adenylyltransferase [Candidatus Nitrospira bockiana]
MNTHLAQLIDAFLSVRVLVVGDAILDGYLEGGTGRLCREAPVPIVSIAHRRYAPGGAANTAANVASLGAQATILSVVGDDREGDVLCDVLRGHRVAVTGLLKHAARRTVTKQRVVADSQILVRFDEGTEGPLDHRAEQWLVGRLVDLFAEHDAIIVSDYGAGVWSPLMISALADLQRSLPRVLVVDSRSQLRRFRKVGATAVKPNYAEALDLLGRSKPPTGARADVLHEAGPRILELTGAQIAAVTLDTDGALLFERDRPVYRTYARPARHARAAGAGDTFVAALTMALAIGAHTPAAAELASAAAAVVVAKDGTAVCAADEVRDYIAPEGKVSDLRRLTARVLWYREQGRRIVFTNGCFDLLHSGHITYLNHAKALGDVLIVGVNSDGSVQRLKGPRRPINPLEDRLQVLAALSSIDHLIAFDDDTPTSLLEALRPDVYVKGGDYTRETLPEAPVVEALGGSIRFLPYVEDQSTTGIIERIRAAADGRIPARTRGVMKTQVAGPPPVG